MTTPEILHSVKSRRPLRIGCGSGFWGDSAEGPDAAVVGAVEGEPCSPGQPGS